jgi:hypothetical protein
LLREGIGCIICCILEKAKDREDPSVKCLTFCRQVDAISDAVEHFEFQRVFQRLDLSANRTLGYAKLLSSACNAQAIAHNRKGSERG